MFEYSAVVDKVHDGDTITVDLDLGLNVHVSPQKIRLIGINAPEMKVPIKGAESRLHLVELLGTSDAPIFGTDGVSPKTIYLATIKVAGHELFDNYGRLLAWIYLTADQLERGLRSESINYRMWTDHFAIRFMAPKDWPTDVVA